MLKEQELMNKAIIYVPVLNSKTRNQILEILLVTIIEILSNTIYLKEIEVGFERKEEETIFKSILKMIMTFS